VTDDLDRLLAGARAEFPRPDAELTAVVRSTVLERLRRRAHRSTPRARALLIPVIAAAASAFVLGHWVVTPAASAHESSSLLIGATAPPPQTVLCRSGIMVYFDPEGRVTVLQYAMTPGGVPAPTGATIAYADPATRSLTRVCPSTPNPKLRAGTLVGPWPRGVSSRIFCSGLTPDRQMMNLQVEIRPVLNRSGRRIGNRLVVAERGLIVVDGRITRTGGGISFDPFRCARNVWK
jgi:hypothetical protein